MRSQLASRLLASSTAAIALAGVLFVQPVRAQDTGVLGKSVNLPPKKHYFHIGIGLQRWGRLESFDLGEVLPGIEGSGTFDALGFSVEMGYHQRVGGNVRRAWLFGGDFGIFTYQSPLGIDLPANGGTTLNGELELDGFYLTPSTRLILGRRGSMNVVLGGGLGFYRMEIVNLVLGSFVTDQFEARNAPGGYLSVGGDLPLTRKMILRLEIKVHYVDFGGLGANSSALQGPLTTLQFAVVY